MRSLEYVRVYIDNLLTITKSTHNNHLDCLTGIQLSGFWSIGRQDEEGCDQPGSDSMDMIYGGKLPREIFPLWQHSLSRSPSRLTIADWLMQLILQVLQMSHVQWVFRNISLHDANQGYIRVRKRETILQEALI